jgi:hypothetical protein
VDADDEAMLRLNLAMEVAVGWADRRFRLAIEQEGEKMGMVWLEIKVHR